MMINTSSLMTEFVVGVDIGGTNLRIGAIAPDGSLLRFQLESSRSLFRSGAAPAVLADYINAFIDSFPGRLRGICVGFPGTVSKDKRTVLSCTHLPTFSGQDVGGLLSGRFGVPAICEHDVILLLAGDLREFDLAGQDCVAALYVGTGLGNALYIHGRFVNGKNGVSGELGHIPVPGSTRLCPCGNVGCLELYSAGKRLEEIRGELFPELDDFGRLFTLHSDHPAVLEFLDYIAIAAATEINILDPDTVLLSGGVVNMPDFPYERLLERIRFHARKPYPEQSLCFLRGTQDKCAGIRGAGIYLWERLRNA